MKDNKNCLLRNKIDVVKLTNLVDCSISKEARRILILQMLDCGVTQRLIAKILHCSVKTIFNIKKTYLNLDLESATNDAPRSGKPRKIGKHTEELLIANVCATPPQGFARWTLSLIQKTLSNKKIADISKESIRIILGNQKIKPWIYKMWCIPKVNEEFIDRMEEVLLTYEKPYDKDEPVVCLDEKLVTLSDSKREPQIENASVKQDYEYARCGTANAFCAIEPKSGNHITQITHRRTKLDFADFLQIVSQNYKEAKKIHLVMDNLNTHFLPSLIERFGEDAGKRLWGRFLPHYTPKHASWLNQAEIEIGMFAKTCLGKRRIPSFEKLSIEANSWNAYMNKEKIKINWQFSRDKARAKFKYSRGKN